MLSIWEFLYYIFVFTSMCRMYLLMSKLRRSLRQHRSQLAELQPHMIHLLLEMIDFNEMAVANQGLDIQDLAEINQSVRGFVRKLQDNRP